MTENRVVITGMGVVSPLGSSIEKYWDGLVNGRSGIRRITYFNPDSLPCQIAGEVPDFNPKDFILGKEARRISRSAQLGISSAIQAFSDAGMGDTVPEPERGGVIFGTAMGGFERLIDGIEVFRERGLEKVNPFILPSGIPNSSAFLISQRFQCLGHNATIVTACATGTQTIGEAASVIKRGLADVMIAGGTEGLVRDFSIAGFCAMRALPINYNDNPVQASRPFDLKREGFVFSEGAGAVVLEREDRAVARGAHIYAEVLGYASSTDGYHIAVPHPEGEGAIRTMKWALQDAGVNPGDVDLISAHGSSTPLNDRIESNAIKSVFGDRAYRIPINSTKSMIGHPMGASGTLEAIGCALSIKNKIIHPTINLEYPDPECDLDYVPNHARDQNVGIALSNSFGLGGQNACIVLKNYES